jgi:hypothetical protein
VGRPRPRQHTDWPRHHCVTTTSSCCRSPPQLGLVKGVVGTRRRLRCDQANRENAARSARAPLKNGAAVGESRLKIATDVKLAHRSPRPDKLKMRSEQRSEIHSAHTKFVRRLEERKFTLPYNKNTRGITTIAGGPYLAVALVSIRMLRRTGSKITIGNLHAHLPVLIFTALGRTRIRTLIH